MSALTRADLWRVKFERFNNEPVVAVPEGASFDTIAALARLAYNEDRRRTVPSADDNLDLTIASIERLVPVYIDAAVLRLRIAS